MKVTLPSKIAEQEWRNLVKEREQLPAINLEGSKSKQPNVKKKSSHSCWKEYVMKQNLLPGLVEQNGSQSNGFLCMHTSLRQKAVDNQAMLALHFEKFLTSTMSLPTKTRRKK
eukprot:1152015-Pelagomonas_calceolata.AAC.14